MFSTIFPRMDLAWLLDFQYLLELRVVYGNFRYTNLVFHMALNICIINMSSTIKYFFRGLDAEESFRHTLLSVVLPRGILWILPKTHCSMSIFKGLLIYTI